MNRLTKAITLACLVGVAALAPVSGAVASTTDATTTTSTTTTKAAAAPGDLIPYRHGTKSCHSEQACATDKRAMIREGYRVSKIYQSFPGQTCVDGCPGPYYFHYWKPEWK